MQPDDLRFLVNPMNQDSLEMTVISNEKLPDKAAEERNLLFSRLRLIAAFSNKPAGR
jgi:hypothetical protein